MYSQKYFQLFYSHDAVGWKAAYIQRYRQWSFEFPAI